MIKGSELEFQMEVGGLRLLRVRFERAGTVPEAGSSQTMTCEKTEVSGACASRLTLDWDQLQGAQSDSA